MGSSIVAQSKLTQIRLFSLADANNDPFMQISPDTVLILLDISKNDLRLQRKDTVYAFRLNLLIYSSKNMVP